MNATESLKRDHELILDGLDALAAIAQRAQVGGAVPEEKMRKLLAFFREFADGYHHRKEESAFFPALEEAGIPAEGPIAVMLEEHEMGRAFLKEIADSLPNLAVDAAMEYVNLLQGHIEKENNVLFNIADRMLSSSDDRALTNLFSEVENGMPHVVDRDAYRRFFADLRSTAKS